VLPLARALEAILEPAAGERWSPLSGDGLLAVDLAGEPPVLETRQWMLARTRLARLPCVTVALVESEAANASSVLDCFDVVARSPVEQDLVKDAVRRAPLTSLALVQLLRLGEALPIDHALTCESLVYSTLQGGPEFARWLAEREPPTVRSAEAGPAVRISREDGRVQLVLDRPATRNALSVEVRDALCDGMGVVVADPSVTELVFSGNGRDFCSGGDLSEFGTLPDPATAHAVRSTRSPARLLAQCAERAIAHVHGACIGAGAELPAFCRRVVAREDAFFQLPEVAMGLVPGAGGTVSLPRRIGRQRTAWLALTGRRIDASTALEWGLVDEVREGAHE